MRPTRRPAMIALRSALFWLGLLLVLPQAWRVRRRAERFEDATGATEGVAGVVGDAAAGDAAASEPAAGDAATGDVVVGDAAAGEPAADEPLRLVGIGDSIIAGVGARTHEQGCVVACARALAAARGRPVRWTILGGTGATTSGVRRNLVPRLPAGPVDAFLVSCGVNDLTDLRGTARFARDLGALVDALQAHAPGAHVLLYGVPTLGRFPRLPEPMRSVFGLRGRTFDAVMARVAASRARVLHMVIDPAEFTPESFAADGYHPSEASYARMGREAGEWLGGVVG